MAFTMEELIGSIEEDKEEELLEGSVIPSPPKPPVKGTGPVLVKRGRIGLKDGRFRRIPPLTDLPPEMPTGRRETRGLDLSLLGVPEPGFEMPAFRGERRVWPGRPLTPEEEIEALGLRGKRDIGVSPLDSAMRATSFFVTKAVETASFGLPKYAARVLGIEPPEPETPAEQIAGTVGTVAGYLIGPWSVAKGIVQKATPKVIARVAMRRAAKRGVKISAKQALTQTNLVMKAFPLRKSWSIIADASAGVLAAAMSRGGEEGIEVVKEKDWSSLADWAGKTATSGALGGLMIGRYSAVGRTLPKFWQRFLVNSLISQGYVTAKELKENKGNLTEHVYRGMFDLIFSHGQVLTRVGRKTTEVIERGRVRAGMLPSPVVGVPPGAYPILAPSADPGVGFRKDAVRALLEPPPVIAGAAGAPFLPVLEAFRLPAPSVMRMIQERYTSAQIRAGYKRWLETPSGKEHVEFLESEAETIAMFGRMLLSGDKLVLGVMREATAGEERAAPVKAAPEVKIPDLKSTEEALSFGRRATKGQVGEMRRLAREADEEFSGVISVAEVAEGVEEERLLNEAMKVALRGQLLREAISVSPGEITPTTEKISAAEALRSIRGPKYRAEQEELRRELERGLSEEKVPPPKKVPFKKKPTPPKKGLAVKKPPKPTVSEDTIKESKAGFRRLLKNFGPKDLSVKQYASELRGMGEGDWVEERLAAYVPVEKKPKVKGIGKEIEKIEPAPERVVPPVKKFTPEEVAKYEAELKRGDFEVVDEEVEGIIREERKRVEEEVIPEAFDKKTYADYRKIASVKSIKAKDLEKGKTYLIKIEGKEEPYTVVSRPKGSKAGINDVFLQDGKKLVKKADQTVTVIGEANDPILTGWAGGRTISGESVTKDIKVLRRAIHTAASRKGLGDKAKRDLFEKYGGQRSLVDPTPMTLEQLNKVRAGIGGVGIEEAVKGRRLKRKSEAAEEVDLRVRSLKENLTKNNQMDEITFSRILDKEAGPKIEGQPRRVTKKAGRRIVGRMNDEAEILRHTLSLEKPIRENLEISKAVTDIDKTIEKKRKRGLRQPWALESMRYYNQQAEKLTEAPVYTMYQAMVDTHNELGRGREDTWKGIKDSVGDYPKVASDEKALQRVSDYIASKSSLKGKPEAPKDMTEDEVSLAKAIQKVLKVYENKARSGKFFNYVLKGQPIPEYDKYAKEIDKAVEIYESKGKDAVLDYLKTQEWGVVRSGYEPLQVATTLIRLGKLDPSVIGDSHVYMRTDIEYKPQEKNILQRLDSYMRQMDMLSELQPQIHGYVRLLNDNMDAFKDPRKVAANIEQFLSHLKHYNVTTHPVARVMSRMYGQTMKTIILPNIATSFRNTLQNLALEPDKSILFDPRNKTLSVEDVEYIKTHVLSTKALLREYFMTQEKPIPGLKHLTKALEKVAIYPYTDIGNRYWSYWAKINQVRRAMKESRDTKDMMRRAKFSDMSRLERKQALGILAKDGDDAMARYVARVHVDDIHFRYPRMERSPAEMGEVGTLVMNLALFPRAYTERIFRAGAKVLDSDAPLEERYRGMKMIFNMIFGGLIADAMFRKVTGRKQSPYNPLTMMTWQPGGLALSSAKQVADGVAAISLAARGDKRALARLTTILPRTADMFIPFYDYTLRGIEAVADKKNIDRKALRRIREIIDKDYRLKESAYEKDRTIINKFRYFLAGPSVDIEEEEEPWWRYEEKKTTKIPKKKVWKPKLPSG